MEIGLELYRKQVVVSADPRVVLSAIDVAPEHPRHTFLFIHGFGGHARHWVHQLNTFALDSRVIAIDLRGHGRSDLPSNDLTLQPGTFPIARPEVFGRLLTDFLISPHLD